MSFESFERHQANELLEQGEQKYGIDKKWAEAKANPEFGEQIEKKEIQEEKNKETDKKMADSKENIAHLEAEDKSNDHPTPEELLAQMEGDFGFGMWDFDDSSTEVASQIGHTEWGTSMDTSLEK